MLSSVENIIEDLEIEATSNVASVITRMIKAKSRLIEGLIGYEIKRLTHTAEKYDILSYRWRQTLYLNQQPILSVSSLKYNGNVVSADDFKVYENYIYSDLFYPGNQIVEISYIAGYEEVPDDIEEACRMLVIDAYNRRKGREVKSESIGPLQRSFVNSSDREDSLPKEVQEVINRYARTSI
jgi:hypothetical protein